MNQKYLGYFIKQVQRKQKLRKQFNKSQFNKSPQQNLSKEELETVASLSKNKDIVIQKSDKGNSVVIVDKETYKRMENILSGQRKFERITRKNAAFLNFVEDQEKRIDNNFKNLGDSNSMSKEMPKSTKPAGTRSGTMHGICKVHKQEVDGYFFVIFKIFNKSIHLR